jgi:glucose-6-phosphate isomerase
VETQLKQTRYEQNFSELLTTYPDLRKHEQAIRDLQKVNGGTFEEIAISYGFTTQDKLERARDARQKMVSSGYKPERQKSIAEMSPAEYDARKKENGVTYSAGLSKK